MKKLLLFVPLLVLFSCSVQKRKYNKGFYVNWHAKESREKTTVAGKHKQEQNVKEQTPEAQPVEAVLKGAALPGEKNTVHSLSKTTAAVKAPPEDTCDVLVFKDGSEIKGKVLEINPAEVKYKRCDATSGPTYISKKSELFMIKYANGTREVIKSDVPEPRVQAPVQRPQNNPRQIHQAQNHPQAMLSLFLGIAAMVSFYIMLLLSPFGFGTWLLILPLLLAIATVVMSKSAMRHIREAPEVWKGKGMAVTGFVFGLIVLGIYAILLTFAVLVLII